MQNNHYTKCMLAGVSAPQDTALHANIEHGRTERFAMPASHGCGSFAAHTCQQVAPVCPAILLCRQIQGARLTVQALDLVLSRRCYNLQ